MAGFRSRVADVLSAIKGSTIEPQSVNTDDTDTDNLTVNNSADVLGFGPWDKIISFTGDPDTATHSFSLDEPLSESPVGPTDALWIEFVQINVRNPADAIRLTSDQINDGNYWYQHTNQAAQSNANFWELVVGGPSSGTSAFTGHLYFYQTQSDTSLIGYTTVGQQPDTTIAKGGTSDFGLQDFEIELVNVGDDEFQRLQYNVYRRAVEF